MHLDRMRLSNFRVYENFETDFSKSLNVITGDNGVGKSTILEAVHYLSLTKSFRSNRDEDVVRFDSDFFMSTGTFISDNGVDDTILVSFSRDTGKSVKSQGKKVSRHSDIVGRHSIVMLSTEDMPATLSSPSGHRRFMNLTISQVNASHLNKLVSYRTLLRQRNSAIGLAASGNRSDEETLDVIEGQLGELCNSIISDRNDFIEKISPEFETIFSALNEGKKEGTIAYNPSIKGNKEELLKLFRERRSSDYESGYTVRGPHRDRLSFNIDGRQLKKFGSKGENKIFLVALKLAQGNYTAEISGVKPIYLLDDIFMELDRSRALKTMEYINKVGQVIITTTDFEEWSELVDTDVNIIGLS